MNDEGYKRGSATVGDGSAIAPRRHSGIRIQVGEDDQEWELAKDEELDHMTAEQLVYLYNAIEVTLQDRGAVLSDGDWWIP